MNEDRLILFVLGCMGISALALAAFLVWIMATGQPLS
jgi:hypothetical protein